MAAAPVRIGGLLLRSFIGAACLGGCRGSLDLDRFRFEDPSVTDERLTPDAGSSEAAGGSDGPCVFGRARVGQCQLVAR